jgi:hypothetical protein
MEKIKEQIIIVVPYTITYKEGFRDEAIKRAEQVPLGIHGCDSSAVMVHGDKRGGEPRGKIKR